MKSHAMKSAVLASGLVALLLFGGVANAAIILDDEGVGFVGKGDVQLMFGWNNAQLQSCATTPLDVGCLRFDFELNSEVVTESTWVCTNSNNDTIQERERTTTTSTTTGGISASVARVKNQVTGFNLNGGVFSSSSSSTTEGPTLNSCPSGPWSLTTPAGAPVEVSNTSSKQLTVTDTRDNTSHTVDVD